MCGDYDVYWSCVVKLYIINKATTLYIKQYIIMSFGDIHNTTIERKAYRCIKMDCGCCNSGSKKKKNFSPINVATVTPPRRMVLFLRAGILVGNLSNTGEIGNENAFVDIFAKCGTIWCHFG